MADIRVTELPQGGSPNEADIIHGVANANAIDVKYTIGDVANYVKGTVTSGVSSVFTRTGAVVAEKGDYSTTLLGDVANTTATDGQILVYNAANAQYFPTAAPATGVTSVQTVAPIQNNGNAAVPRIYMTQAVAGPNGSDGYMTQDQANKLAGIANDADQFIGTDLSYAPLTRTLGSSTGNGVVLPEVSANWSGLMTPNQKNKLDSVEANATNYTLPVASATTLGGIRIGAGLKMTGEVCSTEITGGLRFLGVRNVVTNGPVGTEDVGDFWVNDDGNSGTTNSGWGPDGIRIPTAVTGREMFAKGNAGWVMLGKVGVNAGVLNLTAQEPIYNAGNAESPIVAIREANATTRGTLSNDDWKKLQGIEANAQKNVGTDLNYTPSTRWMQSSTGANAQLPLASNSVAGLMTSAQYNKLTNLPDNAASGTVTSVGTGTGLTGGPITTTGTIKMTNTGVSAGSYSFANITVDAQGRITSAASGTVPATGVTRVTGTAPITVTSQTTTPNVSMLSATTGRDGYMTKEHVQALNNAASYTYTLPTASSTIKGGIRVGNYLYMSGDIMHVDATTGNTSNKIVARDGNGKINVGEIACNSLTATGNVCAYSDARIKQIIGQVEPSPYDQSTIKAYYYRRTDQQNTPVEIGFIAQEVQRIYPEVVHQDENGTLMVDYQRMTSILWQQVQDMNHRVTEMMDKYEEIVSRLEEEINK